MSSTSITPGAQLVDQDNYPFADNQWTAVASAAAQTATFRAWATCATR